MLKRIEPERIICYNTPFPEMQGNIVFVDYELSSWKYQNEDKPFVKFFTGRLIPYKNDDIIYKRGYVLSALQEKGMGTERDRVRWTKKGALLSEETQSLARRFIDEARGQCF